MFVVETKDKSQDGGEKMQEQKGFDLEAITQELDAEFSEENVTQDEEVTEPETQVQDDTELSEAEEGEIEAEETSEPKAPAPNDEDIRKRNEAFKKLREERDQMAKSDKFLSDLAAQYNMSKEELINKYNEELNVKKAKEQGIDPAQFKKMQEMENKIQKIEQEKQREVFNLRANQIAEKYRLSENQMMQLFNSARQLNIDVMGNPGLLEFIYRAVNYDNAIEQGRQVQLETTKKRKSTSTGSTGTVGKKVDTTEAEIDKEIENYLKENNIIRS